MAVGGPLERRKLGIGERYGAWQRGRATALGGKAIARRRILRGIILFDWCAGAWHFVATKAAAN